MEDNVSRAVVRIGGLEYTIKGNESEEYLHKVAIYVDKKMKSIEKTHFNLSTSMLAVLTSINLADEVLKADEEIEALKGEIETLKEEVEILNDMLVQLEDENKTLKEILERQNRQGIHKQEPPKKPNTPVIYDVARSNKGGKR